MDRVQTRSMTRAAAAAAAAAAGSDRDQPPLEYAGETASIGSIPSVLTTDKTLRNYQSKIAKTCQTQNTLVVLPTGSGKTAIAAEVIKAFAPSALFLVPTRDLVKQQAKAMRSWTGLSVAEFSGGCDARPDFEVLVATAGAFRDAQMKKQIHKQLQWSSFRVVVFDEVHHVLKGHEYRELALSLGKLVCARGEALSAPRVLGLTASYSYEFGDPKAKDTLNKMCRDLRITATETATREELERDGFHSTGAAAEVHRPPSTITPPGVLPKDKRDHQPATIFLLREITGSSTDFARRLMVCVRGMEEAIVAASEHPGFTSPLVLDGKIKTSMWGAYAHKLAHSDVGLMTTRRRSRPTAVGKTLRAKRHPPLPQPWSSRCPMLAELEYWYEAVKILVVSWEEREDDAATILDIFGCTGSASQRRSEHHQPERQPVWPTSVLKMISAFWAGVPEDFPRYEHLKGVLLKKYDQHGASGSSGGDGGKKGFRGIVFVRQRVSTHVLAHVIANDPRLARLFSTTCLHSASSPATASLALSKKDTQKRIDAFRCGSVNLLLATEVAEEGMDIPAANCVIRYDPLEHVVSMVQGRGRAREKESSFVVLHERPDRTVADLEAVEQRRVQTLHDFEPEPTEALPESDQLEMQGATTEDTRSTDTRTESGEAAAEALDPFLASGSEKNEPHPEDSDMFVEQRGVRSMASGATGNQECAADAAEALDPFSSSESEDSEPHSGHTTVFVERKDATSMASGTTSDDECVGDQRGLELEARDGLLDVQAKYGLRVRTSAKETPIPPPGVLAAVDAFAAETNAVLKEAFKQEVRNGPWVCDLSYESPLRNIQAAGGAAGGKKMARKLAATALASELIRSTAPVDPNSGSKIDTEKPNAPIEERVDMTRGSNSADQVLNTSCGGRLTDQQRLEGEARSILLDMQEKHGLGVTMSASGTPTPPPGVLAAVYSFADKTNVDIKEKFEQEPGSGLWVCSLLYDSPLRFLQASGGAASGKKMARKLAATALASGLISNTEPVGPDDGGTTSVDSRQGTTGADESPPLRTNEAFGTHASRSRGEVSDTRDDARLAEQRHRERVARSVLLDVQAKHGLGVGVHANGTPIPPPGVLAAVDMFGESTGATLKEKFEQEPGSGDWVCTLLYESALRRVQASGGAVSGKRMARKLAAAKLVANLLSSK